MKRSKPTAADFAFDDLSDKKKINFWPALAFILVVLAIIALAVLILSNQYSENELKRLFNGGSL